MLNHKDVTGTLENWKWSNTYIGTLEGDIYGDSKRRFSDGQRVHTSTIVACDLTEDTGFVKTLNSYYKLGKKFIPKDKDISEIKEFFDLF